MFSFAAHQAQRVPAEALEDNGIKFDNVITSWAEPITLVLLIIVFDSCESNLGDSLKLRPIFNDDVPVLQIRLSGYDQSSY